MVKFRPSSSVLRMHTLFDRFGYTNDVSVLASGDIDEILEYKRGLYLFASVICIAFGMWVLLLGAQILIKRVRKSKLNGEDESRPNENTKTSSISILTSNFTGSVKVRRIFQTIFITSSVLLLIFTRPLYSEGLRSIQKSIFTLKEKADEMDSLIFVGLNVVSDLQAARTDFDSSVENNNQTNHLKYILTFNQTTLSDRSIEEKDIQQHDKDEILEDGQESVICVFDHNMTKEDFSKAMMEMTNDLNSTLEEFKIFRTEDIIEMKNYLDKSTHTVSAIKSFLNELETRDWYFNMYILVLLAITGLLLLGVILSRCDKVFEKFVLMQTIMLFPLFFLCIIVTVFGASAFGAASLITSDFCAGGSSFPGNPDNTLHQIFAKNGLDQSGLYFDIISHSIQGCPQDGSSNYPIDTTPLQTRLEKAIMSTTIFLTTANTLLVSEMKVVPEEEFTAMSLLDEFGGKRFLMDPETCRNEIVVTSDLEMLIEAGTFINRALIDLLGTCLKISNTLHCRNLNSMYRSMSYVAVCSDASSGITNVMLYLLGIGLFGMILLTLRSARFEVSALIPTGTDIKCTNKPERRVKRWRNVHDREFDEYQTYMDRLDNKEMEMQKSPHSQHNSERNDNNTLMADYGGQVGDHDDNILADTAVLIQENTPPTFARGIYYDECQEKECDDDREKYLRSSGSMNMVTGSVTRRPPSIVTDFSHQHEEDLDMNLEIAPLSPSSYNSDPYESEVREYIHYSGENIRYQ